MNKKSIISIGVMIAVIVGFVSYNSFFNQVVPAGIVTGGYRDGIALTPTDYDSTGISVGTSFIVGFEEGSEMTLEQVKESFRSDPEGTYAIEEVDGNISVKPTEALAAGTLYKFYLGNTSWLYMSESTFSLIGTLPANQTTNVPFDTGIEMYFTHQGANVEDFFEIQPNVSGKFETYGNAVVFIPKKLDAETIYTVTLKKGLSLEGSEAAMSEDYSFSFETSYNESGTYKEQAGYFNYRRILNDFSTDEKIFIPFNYNIYKEDAETIVKSKVYQLESVEQGKEAIEHYLSYPSWSNFKQESDGFETKDLKEVLELEQTIEGNNSYESNMIIEADLEKGLYIIESTWEDITFATMIQVSDLSAYFFEDEEEQYFWGHNLSTNQVVEDLAITELAGGKSGDAQTRGVVSFDKKMIQSEGLNYYKLQSGDLETLFYSYEGYSYNDASDAYWSYLQTDRNLYQPDDVVEFYGFLQHRDEGETPSKVSVEINEQRWYYWDIWPGMGSQIPLISETIDLDGGFYEGKLDLPNLSEGGYEILIKDGETVLSRHYITVEKYVKPDYKMEVTKDKEAILIGEQVNFEMKTSFFEGTPVSQLPVYFNVQGMDWEENETETDMEGKVTYAYTPAYQESYQDQIYASFSARAILPESGELYGNESVRIFVNDLDIAIETDLEDEAGVIEAKVNTITLDRLNDGTAEDSNDFLDQAVENHSFKAVIYRNEWVKTEIGESYDYINKVVRKNYDYHLVTSEFDSLDLVTDVNGNAKALVTLPKEDQVYYSVDITTTDTKGRPMMYNRYFNDYNYNYYYDDTGVTLEGAKESYRDGEGIELTLTKAEKPLEALDYMYIVSRTGIQERYYTKSSTLTMTFDKNLMPNAQVFAVAFTGDGYIVSDELNLQGDYDTQKISLEVQTDQETYKPGDSVTIDLTASYDLNGQQIPVSDAYVSISLVDEALFALRDQSIDTLNDLYHRVSSGIISKKGTHNNGENDGVLYGLRGGATEDTMAMMKSDDQFAMVESAMPEMEVTSEGGAVVTRSEFKDTALFASVKLNEEGLGTLTFKLPDNVTSWRLTTSAISDALQAGSDIESVTVSLPFFINPNLNTTYLVGDQPFIGVVGYGDALTENEEITYEVRCDAVDFTSTIKGKAFEKVTLPMWMLTKGVYEITVTGKTASGLSDGYVEVIEVVDTYQQMLVSDTYDASKGLTLKTNDFGMTSLTFADRSRGMYVPTLYNLAYASGKRVDQTYSAYVASKMLEDEFDIKAIRDQVSLNDYISESGGITLLPYSEADLETTVKMIPYLYKANDLMRAKAYLYKSMVKSTLTDRIKAVYGLALAGEPVLLDLNILASAENLSYEDHVYIALAYSVLGDDYMAQNLYDEFIAQYVEAFDTMSRVLKGKDEEAYIYNTSILLPLVAKLGSEEAQGMFAYVNNNYSKTYLTNLDRLRYMELMMSKAVGETSSLKYSYDGKVYEVDFDNYYGKTIKLPSAKLDVFKVEEVSADVMIIANYNGFGVIDKPVDSSLSVKRHYEDYESGEIKGNFVQGDIVKVVIDWEVKDQAIDDYYQVIDYAASGLVPIKNPWNYGLKGNYYWYRDIDGQSVSFGVSKGVSDYSPLYYYARVVSPGTFTADATIIQGSRVMDSYNLGDLQTITIEP